MQCSNCSTTTTPRWRRVKSGQPVCNACDHFQRRNERRPVPLKKTSSLSVEKDQATLAHSMETLLASLREGKEGNLGNLGLQITDVLEHFAATGPVLDDVVGSLRIEIDSAGNVKALDASTFRLREATAACRRELETFLKTLPDDSQGRVLGHQDFPERASLPCHAPGIFWLDEAALSKLSTGQWTPIQILHQSPFILALVDTQSQRESAKLALRSLFQCFTAGRAVLGFLIDPHSRLMTVYKKSSNGILMDLNRSRWRDLSGQELFPGFVLSKDVFDAIEFPGPGVTILSQPLEPLSLSTHPYSLTREASVTESTEDDTEEEDCVPLDESSQKTLSEPPLLAPIIECPVEQPIQESTFVEYRLPQKRPRDIGKQPTTSTAPVSNTYVYESSSSDDEEKAPSDMLSRIVRSQEKSRILATLCRTVKLGYRVNLHDLGVTLEEAEQALLDEGILNWSDGVRRLDAAEDEDGMLVLREKKTESYFRMIKMVVHNITSFLKHRLEPDQIGTFLINSDKVQDEDEEIPPAIQWIEQETWDSLSEAEKDPERVSYHAQCIIYFMPLLGDSGERDRHLQRADYLNKGKCRLIWVLDPVTGKAQIYTKKSGLKNFRLRKEKMWTILDGGDLFPGFFLSPFLLERVARQDPDEDSCVVRCPICDEMLWHAFLQEHIRDMHP